VVEVVPPEVDPPEVVEPPVDPPEEVLPVVVEIPVAAPPAQPATAARIMEAQTAVLSMLRCISHLL